MYFPVKGGFWERKKKQEVKEIENDCFLGETFV